MAPVWDEHKAELEFLYLRHKPKKTVQEIIEFMKETHGFIRNKKSYERQFNIWGFRKNIKSSHAREIHRGVTKRKSSGKESNVVLYGSIFDLGDPKIKRRIARSTPLLSSSYTRTLESEDEIPYVYTPPAHTPTLAYLLKDLPFETFRRLHLPPDARIYPHLAVMARQMATESSCGASTPRHVIQAQSTSNTSSWNSMLRNALPRLSAPGNISLQRCTKHYLGYLEALVVPEDHDDSSICNDTSSGIMRPNSRNTPYFSLLVYLASNNHLNHGALDFILDFALDLIARRQFEAVFKRSEPTVRALLDLLLTLAVQNRSTKVVKAALSAGAYPDVRVGAEYTALIAASKRGDTEMIEALLNGGADARIETSHGDTALGSAAESRSVYAVKLLLEAGGTSVRHSELALYTAVWRGDREIFTLILNANTGLNVNCRARDGICSTLLQDAVRIGRMDLIELLIQHGAEVNTPALSRESHTALQQAALNGDIEIVKYLLQSGADPNQGAEEQGKTAIRWAIHRKNIHLIELLLEAGADINADAGYRGRTALQEATESANLDLIKLLLRKGADVNAPADSDGGITALQGAVRRRNIHLIELLLEAGADINADAASYGGRTALQAATERADLDLAKLLLRKGANVNAPASRVGGITALQGAAQWGYIHLIELLLEAGADVNAPPAPYNANGTALQIAVKNGRHDVVQLLLNHGADINGSTVLEIAAKNNDSGMVKLLLDRSPNCNTSNAFHAATRNGNVAMILILLDSGADISALPSDGEESILELAVAYEDFDLLNEFGLGTSIFGGSTHGEVEEVEEVAIRFAIVKHKWYRQEFPFVYKMVELSAGMEMYSGNALGMAVEKLRDTNIHLVEFLLKKGIAIDARKDDHSPTALHLAVLLHDFSVIRMLLKAGANIHLLWGKRTIIQTAVEGLRDKRRQPRVIFHAWSLFDSPFDLDDVSYESFFEGIRAGTTEFDYTDLTRAMGLIHTDESEHRTARAMAIAEGQWQQHTAEIVQILLDAGADPNIRDEGAPTSLQLAAHLGCARLVQSLLNGKADVNAPPAQEDEDFEDQTLWTALQASIMVDSDLINLDIIHLLLDHDADINAPAPLGYKTRTALQAAIEKGNIALIQLLLTRGANINASASPHSGMTALQAAAIKGYVGLAARLLEARAEVNAPGSLENGRTALEGAAEMGRLDMVKLLLNAGAGYDERGYPSYETALEYAKKEGHRAVHDVIKDYFDKKLSTDFGNAEDDMTNTGLRFEETGSGLYYDATDLDNMGYLFGDQGRFHNISEWDGHL